MWRKRYSEMNITISFVLLCFPSFYPTLTRTDTKNKTFPTTLPFRCYFKDLLKTKHCCKGQPRVLCDFLFTSLVFQNGQKTNWRTKEGRNKTVILLLTYNHVAAVLSPCNIHLSFSHMLLSNSLLLTTDMNDKKCVNALLFGRCQYYAPGLLNLLCWQCREGLISEPWEDATRRPHDRVSMPAIQCYLWTFYTAQQDTEHLSWI